MLCLCCSFNSGARTPTQQAQRERAGKGQAGQLEGLRFLDILLTGLRQLRPFRLDAGRFAQVLAPTANRQRLSATCHMPHVATCRQRERLRLAGNFVCYLNWRGTWLLHLTRCMLHLCLHPASAKCHRHTLRIRNALNRTYT